MTHLFYIMIIAPLLWEIMAVKNPKRVRDFVKRLNNKKSDELTKRDTTVSVLMFLYIVWVFVGLFTSQWILFGAIILLSTIPKKRIFVRAIFPIT